MRMLDRFEEVQAIMLPSLREERAATYSPFLPIHPRTGVVMQAPVLAHDPRAGTIRWRDPETGEEFETPVTGGKCKLQWKPDWAMRWYALGVDYEMAGKDLIDSVKLSSRIARVLGAEPPAGFNYELFLDENGQKISKSKGNGLTIEAMAGLRQSRRASRSSCSRSRPRRSGSISTSSRATVDDYLGFLEAYPRQEWKERLGNPVWHIHAGAPPAPEILTHDQHGQRRSRSPCCSISPRSPTPKIPRFCGGSCAATIPWRRRKPIPVSIAWFATRSPIFAILSRPRSAIARPTTVERGVLTQISTTLAAIAVERERGRNPARALRHRAADPALSGPFGQGRNARRGRGSRTTSST